MRALLFLVLASSTAFADPKPGSCEAVTKKLGKPLAAWKAPEGCTWKTGAREPQVLKNRAAVLEHLECKDPKKVTVAKQLVVTTRSFSPAQVGLEAYDDGKTLTIISKQVLPCPKDPRPMPGPDTPFAFTLAAGTRTFAEASCNVERACK